MTPFEAITELRHEEKTEDNSDNSVESAKDEDAADSENKNIDKDTNNTTQKNETE